LSTRSLIESFTTWSTQVDALVLATVVETKGSTYSKAGRHLLMNADGAHAGLISGGCLEGDLAEHARQVLASGEPKVITYDMRDDADDLWGIGLGCNGLMRLLLQRIDAEHYWQPFTNIVMALASPAPQNLDLVISSTDPELPAGSCRANQAGKKAGWPTESAATYTEESCVTQYTSHQGELEILHWRTRPWIRLLILGAAPDALPVVQLARELGWEITLADHRPHYLQACNFGTADNVVLVDPDSISTTLSLTDFNAIVVMSHHLETDRKYLQQLSSCEASYIGLLGPTARKQKLLDDLNTQNTAGEGLAKRLHGPVGLDIGADSPETIALSLLSEIQAVIHSTRNG
jgi:xanthine dehydrogenase accessory factor